MANAARHLFASVDIPAPAPPQAAAASERAPPQRRKAAARTVAAIRDMSAGAGTAHHSAATEPRALATAAAGEGAGAGAPPRTRRRKARVEVGSVGWGRNQLVRIIRSCLREPKKEKQGGSALKSESRSNAKSTLKSRSTAESKSKPGKDRYDPSTAIKAIESLFKSYGVLDPRRDSAGSDALGDLTPDQKRARVRTLVRQLGLVGARDADGAA